jgi:hypothetical protein
MRIVYKQGSERTVESYIKGYRTVYILTPGLEINDKILADLDKYEDNLVYEPEKDVSTYTLNPQALKDATKHQSAKRREEYKMSMHSNKSEKRSDASSISKKFISEIKKSSDKNKKKKKTPAAQLQ